MQNKLVKLFAATLLLGSTSASAQPESAVMANIKWEFGHKTSQFETKLQAGFTQSNGAFRPLAQLSWNPSTRNPAPPHQSNANGTTITIGIIAGIGALIYLGTKAFEDALEECLENNNADCFDNDDDSNGDDNDDNGNNDNSDGDNIGLPF